MKRQNQIQLTTSLSGNFRILAVEQRFDKRGKQYLVADTGQWFVPVSRTGTADLPDIFKEETKES